MMGTEKTTSDRTSRMPDEYRSDPDERYFRIAIRDNLTGLWSWATIGGGKSAQYGGLRCARRNALDIACSHYGDSRVVEVPESAKMEDALAELLPNDETHSIEVPPGTNLLVACRKLVAESNRIKAACTTQFNSVVITANPGDDPGDIAEVWQQRHDKMNRSYRPFKADRIEIRRNAGGAFIVLADGLSSGRLNFDEMLGLIVGLTVSERYSGCLMQTRAQAENQLRRLPRIDPTDTDALREREQYIKQTLAEDFPE